MDSSFHGDTVQAAPARLTELFGPPRRDPGDDGKVSMEWRVDFGGEEVRVYDWKGSVVQGRGWHIGACSAETSELFALALKDTLVNWDRGRALGAPGVAAGDDAALSDRLAWRLIPPGTPALVTDSPSGRL